jgi:hypothetical protein
MAFECGSVNADTCMPLAWPLRAASRECSVRMSLGAFASTIATLRWSGDSDWISAPTIIPTVPAYPPPETVPFRVSRQQSQYFDSHCDDRAFTNSYRNF